MWHEKVEYSAVVAARSLTPEGMDRAGVLPLAALAIWSEQGRVALTREENGRGLTFPLGRTELPIVRNDEENIRQETAYFISTLAEELGVACHHVRHVIGLVPSFDGVPAPLQAGVAADGRQTAFVPFGLILANRPQLKACSWYAPTDAANHLNGTGGQLPLAAKHLMLRRLLTGRQTSNLA